MTKLLSILIPVFIISCQSDNSLISDHVTVKIHPYEQNGKMKASAMPELRPGSELINFKRRFEYLLINVPEIHMPENAETRNEIWELYPDTAELKRLYLNKFVQDTKLTGYFEATYSYIRDPNRTPEIGYNKEELTEVASKFFYCDKVTADTSVQAHVCVGLNGISEANWNEDYTLLEAFCYEAIFNDLDQDTSQVWSAFITGKKKSVQKHKAKITSRERFLETVRQDLFDKMKSNEMLKDCLLEYYKQNENNLAFKIKD